MPVRAELERRIQALEMRCYRRFLNICYKDHMTNEEVRSRIQNAVGVHDDILTMVKKRKLRWYGNISGSSGMAKTISAGDSERNKKKRKTEEEMGHHQGMDRNGVWRFVEGSRRQGKVERYSMVPRRPSVLRDWDEMRCITESSSYCLFVPLCHHFYISNKQTLTRFVCKVGKTYLW